MTVGIVVHTQIPPHSACPHEQEVLNVPGVQFFLRGDADTPEKVIEAVRDADIALCGKEPFTREVFARSPRLKAVLRYGVGVDTVDLQSATEHGVIVGYFPDFCIEEVANHALVLMLDCAKKTRQLDHVFRNEGWSAAKAILEPMGSIHGEVMGLIAFGNIARALAKRGQVLGMRVIAYDPYVSQETFADLGVEQVSLEELAAQSDYVSCHMPLTQATKGSLDASFFGRMKPTAYFINTSRGAVVNEADLIDALATGKIAGAGLDVFEKEPVAPAHPFLSMHNVVVTPHVASFANATKETLNRRLACTALTILDGGLPEFVANPAVLTAAAR
jgi:D-3-phosphoglycerate dehydrogenase